MTLQARKKKLEQKLRKLDLKKIALKRKKLREEAQQKPHRFYYFGGLEGQDIEAKPCEGCGEIRGHENHRADLIACYGLETYNRYYA